MDRSALVFGNESKNKVKMNRIQTLLCGSCIRIDQLERLKLMPNDPLIREFYISVGEPETVSRCLGNFNYKSAENNGNSPQPWNPSIPFTEPKLCGITWKLVQATVSKKMVCREHPD
jgi:hypothetical protein